MSRDVGTELRRALNPGRHEHSLLARLTRVWLPLLIAAAGVAGIVIGHGTNGAAGAGVVLLGSALMVWMLNWMFRISVESNKDRDREEQAREHFDRTGRWPDEED